MGYAVSNIKQDVRVILDRNKVSTNIASLQSDVETLSLDDIIDKCIIPAARQVELIAPKELADWVNCKSGQQCLTHPNDNMVSFYMPAGYLRIGGVKLDCWKFGVEKIYTTDSKEYKRQWYGVSGLQASKIKPLAAIVKCQDSDAADDKGDELQLFGGVISTSYVEYCMIVKEPTVTSNELNIGEVLKIPFAYCCASLVAEALKDYDKSRSLMQICANMMTAVPDQEAAQLNNSQTNE